MFDRITTWWNSLFLNPTLKEPFITKKVYPQPIPGLLDAWKRPEVRQAIATQTQRRQQIQHSGPEMK